MDSLEKQFSDVDLIQTGYEDFFIDTDKYIEIADNYAIDFANWLNNHVLNALGKHSRLNGKLNVSDLLILYKREKRL
jgi:hypothetical protein